MMSPFELSSRAALCRRLANWDPANRSIWLAEATTWSRLLDQTLHDEVASRIAFVNRFFTAFHKWSTTSRRLGAGDIDAIGMSNYESVPSGGRQLRRGGTGVPGLG